MAHNKTEDDLFRIKHVYIFIQKEFNVIIVHRTWLSGEKGKGKERNRVNFLKKHLSDFILSTLLSCKVSQESLT